MSKVTEYFDRHETRVLYRDSLDPSLVGYISCPPHCGHFRLKTSTGMFVWMTPRHFKKRYVRHVKD